MTIHRIIAVAGGLAEIVGALIDVELYNNLMQIGFNFSTKINQILYRIKLFNLPEVDLELDDKVSPDDNSANQKEVDNTLALLASLNVGNNLAAPLTSSPDHKSSARNVGHGFSYYSVA